jgi:hypothetical protein
MGMIAVLTPGNFQRPAIPRKKVLPGALKAVSSIPIIEFQFAGRVRQSINFSALPELPVTAKPSELLWTASSMFEHNPRCGRG